MFVYIGKACAFCCFFVAFLFYFLLFSDEHNDDVQYHVEEDNLGIGILVDHRLAFIEKVENIDREGINYNQDKRALHNRWQKPADKAKFKSIKDNSSTPMSSRFVRTENTFSGESISVGYESSAAWIRKIGAEGVTFRAYMNDIFRVSSFKEERGTDYPFARTVSFSLSLRF